MNLEDVLKKCVSGHMPKVRALVDIRKDVKAGAEGTICVIKCDTSVSAYRGIAVKFDSKFDVWFYEKDGSDGRMGYMKNLEFIN